MSNMIVTEHMGPFAKPALPGAVPMAPFQASGGITGKDILRILRKRVWLIVLVTLVFIAVAAVSTFFWLRFSPWYTAEAYLQANVRNNPMRDTTINTYTKDVMERLLLSQIRAINQERLYTDVLREGDPMYNITDTNWYSEHSGDALRDLQEAMKFSAIGSTDVRIAMTGRNATEVAKIVNAVAYQAERMGRTRADIDSEGMVRVLTTEKDSIQSTLDGVRRRMRSERPQDIPMFESARNMVNMQIEEDIRRLATLAIQKAALDAAVAQAEVEDLRNSPEVLYALDMNSEIRSLKLLRVQLEADQENQRRLFGDSHRSLQALRTKIETCTLMINDREQTVIENMVGTIKASRQAQLAGVMEQIRVISLSLEASHTKLRDNEQRIENLRTLGDEERALIDSLGRVDEKLREVRLQKQVDAPLRVTVPASVPIEPSMPRWSIMLPVGLFLGLLAGVGLAFLLELMDSSVKSASDITRRMDLPILGMIPHADDLEDDIRDVRLAVMTNPNSLLGESFRQLRTALRFSGPADRCRSLLVASPMPEDGRTAVAVNLGTAMARDGMKVLVIDANFRQPAVRKLFPQALETGLSNVLAGQCKWSDAISQVEPNLTVMSSGPLPPNPAELLGSGSMRQLVAELSKQFDQIIFDGAPVLIVSDSTILSTVVDATMLVVRAGANTHDVVQRVWDAFRHVGATVIGVTLNGVRTISDGHLRRSYEAFYEYHEQLPGK